MQFPAAQAADPRRFSLMFSATVCSYGATMDCATILSAAKSPSEPKITRPKPDSQRLASAAHTPHPQQQHHERLLLRSTSSACLFVSFLSDMSFQCDVLMLSGRCACRMNEYFCAHTHTAAAHTADTADPQRAMRGRETRCAQHRDSHCRCRCFACGPGGVVRVRCPRGARPHEAAARCVRAGRPLLASRVACPRSYLNVDPQVRRDAAEDGQHGAHHPAHGGSGTRGGEESRGAEGTVVRARGSVEQSTAALSTVGFEAVSPALPACECVRLIECAAPAKRWPLASISEGKREKH